jgi:photosystem II stability/assembly factor-like uncharacterized protein
MVNVLVATAEGLITLGAEPSTELSGRAVVDFSWTASGWWAIVDDDILVHKTTDGEWSDVAEVPERSLNCVLPSQQGAFVGTDDAHLLSVTADQVQSLDSFEEAPGRENWFTPWGGPPDVRSLAQGPNEVYVNVHVGGILRSRDEGHSWSPTIDLRSDVHEVIASRVDGDDMVFAAAAVGLATSADAGESWEIDAENLHSPYARAVAVDGDILFMSACTGPRGGRAAIYRRRVDSPGTFRKVDNGLPEWFPQNIDTGTLDAHGGSVAFGTSDGRVYFSGDAGDSWESIAEDLRKIRKVRVAP